MLSNVINTRFTHQLEGFDTFHSQTTNFRYSALSVKFLDEIDDNVVDPLYIY